MMLKQQFQETVSRLGLDTEVDLYLAEVVWARCEAAHASKSSQTAVLLKNAKIKPASLQHSLTESEVQFLTGLLSMLQSEFYATYPSFKKQIQRTWLLCEPENPDTKEAFTHLNRLKALRNKIKEQAKKVSTIQHKLKKMR